MGEMLDFRAVEEEPLQLRFVKEHRQHRARGVRHLDAAGFARSRAGALVGRGRKRTGHDAHGFKAGVYIAAAAASAAGSQAPIAGCVIVVPLRVTACAAVIAVATASAVGRGV